MEVILILSLFYGSISIVAVVGNFLVIWIVATTRQMQTVTNLFIANLALADVVIGMFAIPFQVSFSRDTPCLLHFYRLRLIPLSPSLSIAGPLFTTCRPSPFASTSPSPSLIYPVPSQTRLSPPANQVKIWFPLYAR